MLPLHRWWGGDFCTKPFLCHCTPYSFFQAPVIDGFNLGSVWIRSASCVFRSMSSHEFHSRVRPSLHLKLLASLVAGASRPRADAWRPWLHTYGDGSFDLCHSKVGAMLDGYTRLLMLAIEKGDISSTEAFPMQFQCGIYTAFIASHAQIFDCLVPVFPSVVVTTLSDLSVVSGTGYSQLCSSFLASLE